MQDDKEGQEVWRMLVDAPAKDGGDDDRVSQAADREKLGDTLDERDEQGLKGCHGELSLFIGQAGQTVLVRQD
jgi:hypothetical protein